jgi:hypothetical protein
MANKTHHIYLWIQNSISFVKFVYLNNNAFAYRIELPDCHTCFSKENQLQTYMHARINFHAHSWHKWITKTISRKKKEYYQRFTLSPRNGGTKLHKQSTGGCVRLEPATSSQDFRVASSFWATLFIARVTTCCTQQVWAKEWMQRLYSGLAISI